MNMVTMELDPRLDNPVAASVLDRLQREGFAFTTLAAEQERFEGWLAALCDLDNATRLGDPAVPRTVESFAIRLAELAIDPVLCFVARLDHEYIGYSVLDVYRGDQETIKQSWTGVRPEYRRRGIATALKEIARRSAVARGYSRIRTAMRETNVPSIALNTKFGFRSL